MFALWLRLLRGGVWCLRVGFSFAAFGWGEDGLGGEKRRAVEEDRGVDALAGAGVAGCRMFGDLFVHDDSSDESFICSFRAGESLFLLMLI